jgi:tetratricopeptide (TPR) repeat protein
MTSDLLNEAQRLVSSGNLTDAELVFAKAVEAGNDPTAFLRFGDFLTQFGRLAQAEAMYERALATTAAGPDAQADALRSLAILYLSAARPSARRAQRALAIDERLAREPGIAEDVRTLGNVYLRLERGELDRAEELFERALDIHSRLNDLRAVAKDSGSLGLIYWRRNQLDRAEQSFQRARSTKRTIGRTASRRT